MQEEVEQRAVTLAIGNPDGKSGIVTRPNYVKATALDVEMRPFEIEGTELLARAICHELDHLDGHLYVEKVEGDLLDNSELMDEEYEEE